MLLTMSFKNKSLYCDMPFAAETPRSEFYTYINLSEIPHKCTVNTEELIRCRTIGILQSVQGHFYLNEIGTSSGSEPVTIQTSMLYLKSPPPSTVIPYPVQVFGELQWKKRPVLYVKIFQVLNATTAIRLNNSMNEIAKTHMATSVYDCFNEDSMYV